MQKFSVVFLLLGNIRACQEKELLDEKCVFVWFEWGMQRNFCPTPRHKCSVYLEKLWNFALSKGEEL